MMKILFFDQTLPHLLKDADYPVGGWAVELSNWILGLQAIGAEVEVLTWRGANDYVGRQTHVQLREAYRPEGGIKVLKYLYHHVPAIVAAIRAARPDVVIQACSGLYTGIIAFAAKETGVPFVHRLAIDSDVDDRLREVTPQLYARAAYRWGMARASGVLCQNAYQSQRARDLWPNHAQLVIHNPIAVPADEQIRSEGERRYVAWLANFGPAKNLPLLARVAEANPGLEFRVAGGFSGLATPDTQQAVERLRWLPNVELLGYLKRSQVMTFLAQAKCLLTTSRVEGFSNTFLEAFAAGTPVIAHRCVDPDGVIATHRLGLVAGDDEALLRLPAAIAALSAEEFEQVSARCRTYVRQAHDPQGLAGRLLEFLVKLRPADPAQSLSPFGTSRAPQQDHRVDP